MKHRLFFAFNLSETVRTRIFQVQQDLKRFEEHIKWEPIEKFHITGLFLGNVEESLISDLAIKADLIAKKFKSQKVTFTKIGVFPNLKNARVIWIGIEDNPIITQIAEELKMIANYFKIEIDEKTFHPHVTLGRVKNRLSKEFINYFEKYTFERFSDYISSVDLMKSILDRFGSKYYIQSKFNLKGELNG